MENVLSPTGDTKLDEAVRQWLQYDKVSYISELAYVLWLSCAVVSAEYK